MLWTRMFMRNVEEPRANTCFELLCYVFVPQCVRGLGKHFSLACGRTNGQYFCLYVFLIMAVKTTTLLVDFVWRPLPFRFRGFVAEPPEIKGGHHGSAGRCCRSCHGRCAMRRADWSNVHFGLGCPFRWFQRERKGSPRTS